MFNKENLERLAWPLIIFIFGVIVLPLNGVKPSPDSAWYLNNALDIYKGFNFETLMIKRPLFPLMLALSFNLTGVTVESAFFVVRLFYLSNLLLSYFFGTLFFNRKTGILFSLLVLTSFIINTSSSKILLDSVITFWIVSYLLLLYLACINGKTVYYVSAGITLALSLLTKGVFGVFYVPLPVILIFCVKSYRNKKVVRGIGTLYLSCIGVLSPWLFGILFYDKDPSMLLGPLVDINKISTIGLLSTTNTFGTIESFVNFISNTGNSFVSFTDTYFKEFFVLWPFLISGFIFALYNAIFRKNIAHIHMICAFILFSPIFYVSIIGKSVTLRHGQFLLCYFILYLFLANMIETITRIVVTNRKLNSFPVFHNAVFKRSLVLFIFVVVILGQVFFPNRKGYNFCSLFQNQTEDAKPYMFSLYRGEFKIDGWFDDEISGISNWMMNNIHEGEVLLCQNKYRFSIDFFTQKKYKLLKMGAEIPITSNDYIDSTQNRSNNNLSDPGKLMFVQSNYKFKKGRVKKNIHGPLKFWFEGSLIDYINTHNISYIVLTGEKDFITSYLTDNDSMSLVRSSSAGRIKIYKINSQPVRSINKEIEVKFIGNVYKTLEIQYLSDRNEYQKIKNAFSSSLAKYIRDSEDLFRFIETGNSNEFIKRTKILH